MINYDKNYRLSEEKIYIDSIPCLRLVPEGLERDLKTIIFYHGLDSSKERQRLRAYMLGSFGYQILIPDAIHHGERDKKESQDPKEIAQYFWQAILSNVNESSSLIATVLDQYRADPNHIYVMGHSMGGFSAAGVLGHNKQVRGGILLNGSMNWIESNRLLREAMGLEEDFTIAEEDDVNILNPRDHQESLRDKSILILHGLNDPEVNIVPQREFYNQFKELLDVEMIEYDGLGHFVTTNMMEDALNWLEARA